MRDPYSVLGVDKNADEKAIKSAFRKQAMKYHPDQNPNDPKAKERFAAVNQAYEIIGDKTKRAQFDRGEIDAEGKEQFAGFGGGQGFDPFSQARGQRAGQGHPFGGNMGGMGGAEDILNQMFGGGFGGGPQGRPHPGQQSRGGGQHSSNLDIKAKAIVSIEDLARGKVAVPLPDGKSISASIPPGAIDGQTIRLKGKGKQHPGMAAGDALVTLRFKAHKLFEVSGSDLRTATSVGLRTLIDGGKATVETVDGKLALTIPARTKPDKVFRLKGKGLPKKGGTQGDLLVSLKIEISDGEMDALEAFYRQVNA